MKTRQRIAVGQRLIFHDGSHGYVCLNTLGITSYGPGESFKVAWRDPFDGSVSEEYYTLEQFDEEGIRWGKGRMAWAR